MTGKGFPRVNKSKLAVTRNEGGPVKVASLDATAYDADRPPLPPGASEAGDPLIGRRIDHFEIRGLL